MKRILVFFGSEVYTDGTTRNSIFIDMLNEAATKKGFGSELSFHFAALDTLVFSAQEGMLTVVDSRSGEDVADYDLIFFQRWSKYPQLAFSVAKYLEVKKVPFISSEVAHQVPLDKLSEMVMLVQSGVRYPATTAFPIRLASVYVSSYPCILKAVDASKGRDNYLISDKSQLNDIVGRYANEENRYFMAQPVINASCDYRITIMDGQIVYIIRRHMGADSHLSNIAAGGRGELLAPESVSQEIKDMALVAAAGVGRTDFAGVDIMLDGANIPFVLEVNKSPDIQFGFAIQEKIDTLIEYMRHVGH